MKAERKQYSGYDRRSNEDKGNEDNGEDFEGKDLTSTPKTWQLRAHDGGDIERLGNALRLSPIVAQLLLNRGHGEPESARRFLHSPFRGLHEPELLPGVTAAADRLHEAILQHRRICIYGDYDVDGLTGTAILWEGLRLLGAEVDYYVPHRLDEGYGLHGGALGKIAEKGTAIVVSVDCGIGSVVEAAEARRLGLELIVTDHHELKDQLPLADVLVHPRLPGTGYPFGELSGSGVAFKLAWALCQRASGSTRVTPQFREYLLESVTLAALGMIADVVPLHDENRIFVRHGLARLQRTSSVGLKALLEVTGLSGKSVLRALDVGYTLAPRLNAAGRLGCARLVVELLTTSSSSRALELARFLDKQNEQRQQIERRILAQALEQLEHNDLANTPAIVLASADWHAGVIGIVAGRLVDRCSRPVLLIALRPETEIGQGSGRSVPGFPLHEALAACGDGLLSHGGHAAAVGFKIPQALIEPFRARFHAYAAQHFQTRPHASCLAIDTEVPLGALTPRLVDSLGQLEPYGAGNPRPLFLAGPLQIVGGLRMVGGGDRHISFRVRQQSTEIRAIAFNMADRAEELMSSEGWCSLVFTPSINDWQGRRSVQLEVRDFQPGQQARLG